MKILMITDTLKDNKGDQIYAWSEELQDKGIEVVIVSSTEEGYRDTVPTESMEEPSEMHLSRMSSVNDLVWFHHLESLNDFLIPSVGFYIPIAFSSHGKEPIDEPPHAENTLYSNFIAQYIFPSTSIADYSIEEYNIPEEKVSILDGVTHDIEATIQEAIFHGDVYYRATRNTMN